MIIFNTSHECSPRKNSVLYASMCGLLALVKIPEVIEPTQPFIMLWVMVGAFFHTATSNLPIVPKLRPPVQSLGGFGKKNFSHPIGVGLVAEGGPKK